MIKEITYQFKVNWVLKNKLAIGNAPLNKENFKHLKALNFKSIINLCSEEECSTPKGILSDFIFKRIFIPDHSFKESIKIEQINNVLVILDELLTKGSVFIHCRAAVERSPLICMAWLIKNKNLSINEALNYLMIVNKGSCPLKKELDLLKEIK